MIRQAVAQHSRSLWTGLKSALVILCVLAFGAADVRAQKATEIFIPIGQSPGLSRRSTIVGTVNTVDLENRVLGVVGASGSYSIKLSERTQIWLDRSKIRLTNLTGTPEDCREGVRIEVWCKDGDTNRPAEWIKVEVTSRR